MSRNPAGDPFQFPQYAHYFGNQRLRWIVIHKGYVMFLHMCPVLEISKQFMLHGGGGGEQNQITSE